MEKQKALIHRTLKSQRREKSLRNYQRVKRRRRKTGKRAIQTKTLEKRAPKNRNSRQTLREQKTDNSRLMLIQLKSLQMKMSKTLMARLRKKRLMTESLKRKKKKAWQLKYHQMMLNKVEQARKCQTNSLEKVQLRRLRPRLLKSSWPRGRWTICSSQRRREKSRTNFWTIPIKSLSARTVWTLLPILRTSLLKPHQEGFSKSC